jgi:Flp pilus assembly secretin CpaC
MQLHRTAALLAVLATAAFAQGRPIALVVSTQKTLSIHGIQRVALGDPAIADVKTLGHDELLLVGISAGRTTLLVWKTGSSQPERFEVTVSGPGTVAAPAPPLPADTTPAPTFSPTLKVGGKALRVTPNLQRVAIGDPSIADLSTGHGAVTVLGLSAGTTSVLLWFDDGHREQWLVTVVK